MKLLDKCKKYNKYDLTKVLLNYSFLIITFKHRAIRNNRFKIFLTEKRVINNVNFKFLCSQ
jgi:hypothetical protein